jgi:mono/diheme cytochrome c family protein
VVRKTFLFILGLTLLLAACAPNPDSASSGRPTLTEQEALGQRLFTQNCASCHAITPDTRVVGPSLYNIGETAAERVPGMDALLYIEISIIDPSDYVNEGYQDLMPSTFGTTLTGAELDALVAYLFTLK